MSYFSKLAARSAISQVKAVDKDTGVNGHVTYSIQQTSGQVLPLEVDDLGIVRLSSVRSVSGCQVSVRRSGQLIVLNPGTRKTRVNKIRFCVVRRASQNDLILLCIEIKSPLFLRNE